MAALVWDATGSRRFETGVDHGVLYVMKDNAGTLTDGITHYETGVVWNGLTGVTSSPDGAEPTDLWADNIKYATLRSAETYGATIEAYTYPDEWAVCDGSAVYTTGVYVGQQGRKAFGFCYRTLIGTDTDPDVGDNDYNYLIHIIYNATASPSERSYETVNDSPDAITFSWEITTTPVNVNVSGTSYKPTSEIVIDMSKLASAKRTALLNKLYGSSSTSAELPEPSALLSLINSAST